MDQILPTHSRTFRCRIYCKSSIKRLCGWTSSLVQTYRHLIGPTCMRQKATRSEASGAIVEYMGAIARAWPRHAEQSTFTLLVVAVTLLIIYTP